MNDNKKAIIVVSLYGQNRKPSDRTLKGIDVLIVDIQDVGSTYYTYVSTITHMLEAAAKHDISVIVLNTEPDFVYTVVIL